MNQNFIITFDFRVVVGYDDLVYTTATGMNVILQHGQSWTFECRYKINSEENGNINLIGDPEIVSPINATKELLFEMVMYKL